MDNTNYILTEENVKIITAKNVKNKIIERATNRKMKEGLLEEFITSYFVEAGQPAPNSKRLLKLATGIKSYISFLTSGKVAKHNKDNAILSVPRDFTKQFFLNNAGVKVSNTEVKLINSLLLINVEKHCYNNTFTKNKNTWCAGYILNKTMIENINSISTTKEDVLPREYKILKDSQNVYSFNSDFDFTITYGNNKNINVKSTEVTLDNIDDLQEKDLIINVWEKLSNIPKIVKKLETQKRRIQKLADNNAIRKETCSLKLAQLDTALSMIAFMNDNEYWIDIYRVSRDGRFYAMGSNFQNIPKFIRNIIFNECVEIDQKAAQLQIVCDLSPNSESKEILAGYLQNQDEHHEVIKLEGGGGKKWFKKRRSAALRGAIFSDVCKSSVATQICNAILELVEGIDWTTIHIEERRRTLQLVGNEQCLVWLHDGCIVR